MNALEQKIESLLFFKNEPVSYQWLSKTLGISHSEIMNAVNSMDSFYKDRGIVLVKNDESVSLMTHPNCQTLIQELSNDEDQKELSKQALETLAIIVYRDGVTKSEIDYIRGVNSVFILRNLLVRGLITKKPNPKDKRSPFYIPTHDMLSFLGITEIKDLPDFENMSSQIQKIQEEFYEQGDSE